MDFPDHLEELRNILIKVGLLSQSYLISLQRICNATCLIVSSTEALFYANMNRLLSHFYRYLLKMQTVSRSMFALRRENPDVHSLTLLKIYRILLISLDYI